VAAIDEWLISFIDVYRLTKTKQNKKQDFVWLEESTNHIEILRLIVILSAFVTFRSILRRMELNITINILWCEQSAEISKIYYKNQNTVSAVLVKSQ